MEIALLGIVIAILLLLITLTGQLTRLDRKVERLSRQLGGEPSGITLDPSAQALVEQRLREGKKIEAIRVVRQHTNAPLVEAKEYVDQMERPQGGPFL